jgi:hypothetical protein
MGNMAVDYKVASSNIAAQQDALVRSGGWNLNYGTSSHVVGYTIDSLK